MRNAQKENFKEIKSGNEGGEEEDVAPTSPHEDPLMKPFNLGWKREVVMRAVTISNMCDVYYLHPNGKKLRSMTEVRAHLTDGLTLDCFTFKKQPLNVGSEIVRHAMVRGKNICSKDTEKCNDDGEANITSQSLRKAEKQIFPRSAARQIMIKKKEQKSNMLHTKSSKRSSNASIKRKMKKTGEKVSSIAAKKTANYLKSSGRQCKAEMRKKTAQKVKLSSIPITIEGNTSKNVKCEYISANRKSDYSDIKSIVQRNIGRYRELRKKQIMSKMREGLQERSRTKIADKILRKLQRSEPISNNLQTYLKPLERGWRRELVHRVNGSGSAGKSDVYYRHPNGKKLRSTREIANNLTRGLTLDCFTFKKEALGCGEPLETIRNARLLKNNVTANRKKIS